MDAATTNTTLPPRTCSTCGQPSPSEALACTTCSTPFLDGESKRPLQWKWVGIFAGGMTALAAATQLIPGVRSLFLPLGEAEGYLEVFGSRVELMVSGGLLTLLAILALPALVAGVLGAVTRRRLGFELAVGAAGYVVAQWVIWAILAGGVGPLLGSPVMFDPEVTGSLLVFPPAVLFLILSFGFILVPLGAGAAGRRIAEAATGEARCPSCDSAHSIRPRRPEACPRCGAAPGGGRGVNWALAAPAIGLTAVVFFGVVKLAGPSLGFHWSCDFENPSGACEEAMRKVRRDRDLTYWVEYGKNEGDPSPGVVLDSTKYILYLTPIFLLGPLFVSWFGGRARKKTAGIVLLLDWLAAFVVALLLLGFAQFQGQVVRSVQLHLLAAVPWCLAGAIGLWLGGKLRRSEDIAEELGVEL